jgi:hypothetical protein
MVVEIFTLSLMARVNQNGTFDIGGAFNYFVSPTRSLPVILPVCGIAARIRFNRVEQGAKPVACFITDTRGNVFVGPLVTTHMFQIPANENQWTHYFEMALPQCCFPQYGDYIVHLEVGGNEIAASPLQVR